MKKIISCLIILTLVLGLKAQEFADKKFYLIDSLELTKLSEYDKNLVDSLLHLYHKSSQDSVKLKSIDFIANNMVNPEVWPKYNLLLKSKVENRLKNDKKNKTLLYYLYTFYNNVGYLKDKSGDFDNALIAYRKALKISLELDHADAISTTYSNIGRVYNQQSQYDRALDCYYKSLKIAESEKDTSSISDVYVNIAGLYSSQNDFEKTLSYLYKSLYINEEKMSPQNKCSILSSIASTSSSLGKTDSCLILWNKSLAISEEIGDPYMMSNTYRLMGNFLSDSLPEQALLNYSKSLELSKQINYNPGTAYTLIDIAKLNYKLGYKKTGLREAKEALEFAEKLGMQEVILLATKYLIEIYEAEGMFKEALSMQRYSDNINDSIYNLKTQKELIEKETKYAYEKQKIADQKENEKNIAIEQQEKQQQQHLLYIAIVVFTLIILIIAFAYKKIRSKNHRLNDALEKNETLMKELHHRVKNNLQVISSLLNLQSYNIEDPSALSAVKEGKNRIKSIALIHQKLYQTNNLSEVNFSDYINELTVYLKNIFRNPDQNIIITIERSEVMLDIDTAVPLGLIINELVSNSFKYAFKNKTEGNITISISYIDKTHQKLKLIVNDNGIGLPENLDIEKTSSLGLKLVTMLTKQLDGEVYYENNNGASFNIEISNTDLRKQSE